MRKGGHAKEMAPACSRNRERRKGNWALRENWTFGARSLLEFGLAVELNGLLVTGLALGSNWAYCWVMKMGPNWT